MKQKDQIVSLKLAREMKELGAKQDSIWYWTWAEWNGEAEWVLKPQDVIAKLKREHFSAYTVAELGEMLKPHATALPVWNQYNMGCEWFSSIWTVTGHCQINEKTEADARAKMWVFLKKEKDGRV